MWEAYQRVKANHGGAGVDGQTIERFEQHLGDNLYKLWNRMASGSYMPPPVKRVEIPKGDGRVRPLGIPTVADRVAQMVVKRVLEPEMERQFHPDSYGYRPGKSAHQALAKARERCWRYDWVVDLDIKGFFDTISHKHLREFLDLRIKDGVVRKMLDKWLIPERSHIRGVHIVAQGWGARRGRPATDREGHPQGGVISPLIANAFLHYVLDLWFVETVRPRLRGRSLLVRYADDAVMLFENDWDGQRVLAVLGKRLERYGLRLHPDKTRYLDFRPNRPQGRGKGAAFDFLGFTHYWVGTRKGSSVVRQTTAKSRLARALRDVNDWCRRHRHDAVPKQWAHLASVLRGHGNYYGLRGNSARLSSFRYQVTHIWRKWLSRRSHKARLNWDKMRELLRRYPLPRLRIRPATTAPLFP